MEQQENKRPLYKKWWAWVGGIFAFTIVLSAIGSNEEKARQTAIQTEQKTEQSVTTTSEPSVKVTQPTTSVTKQSAPAPVVQKQYQQVFTFSGSGAKKSEPFTITGSRFKIAYDCSGDLCQSFIYKIGSQIPQLVMNSVGAVKDETIMYGKGEYYLDANTMGSYTMTVYDYK